jgi:acyl transferase domain-containing protein
VAGSVRLYAGLSLHPPAVPIYSCYTGALMTAAQATDPAYWAAQPAAPVRFADALSALLDSGEFLLLEAGPGQGLTSLAAAHRAVRGRRGDGRRRSEPLALLPGHPGAPAADRTSVLRAADRLRTEGYALDPAALDHLRG